MRSSLTAPVRAWLSPRELADARAAVVTRGDGDGADDEPTERRPLTLRELMIMRGAIGGMTGSSLVTLWSEGGKETRCSMHTHRQRDPSMQCT